MDRRNPAIGFIGAGVLGKGLAWALAAKGYRVVSAYSRSRSSAEALAGQIPGCATAVSAQELSNAVDLAFITTPDDVIREVAGSAAWRSGQGVVHCCGAASTELLESATEQGAAAGALHPFQTFGGVVSAEEAEERLQGITVAVSGQGWLEAFLWEMASRIGGRPISIPDADRPLYHAAAILACGHVTALLGAAVEVWRAMGYTDREAMQSLYPLCRATLEAVAAQGTKAAATGPVVRGDADTVKAHLEALSSKLPDLAPVYAALSAATLPLASAKGVASGRIAAMKELTDHYTNGAISARSREGHRI